MTVDEVIKHYGTYYAAAKAVGVARQQASVWKKNNHIPMLQQYRFERLTNGKLVVEDDMINK